MIAVPVDITNVEKRAFEDLDIFRWDRNKESASRVKDVTDGFPSQSLRQLEAEMMSMRHVEI